MHHLHLPSGTLSVGASVTAAPMPSITILLVGDYWRSFILLHILLVATCSCWIGWHTQAVSKALKQPSVKESKQGLCLQHAVMVTT